VTAAVTCTCPQCNKSRHVLRRCRLLPVVPRAFWHVSGTTLRWVVRQPTLVAPWVAAFTADDLTTWQSTPSPFPVDHGT
jgi:hypothetical protein